MDRTKSSGMVLLGIFVAAGLASAGYFVSQTLYNAKVALNTAEAKGLAERRVTSDQANWSVGFKVSGAKRAQVPQLYQQAEQHQATIRDLLKQNGFDDAEIELGVLDYSYQEYRDDKQKLVDQIHMLSGSINVETSKVDKVGAVRASVNKLIAKGIDVENRPPTYRFTRLNDIKPEMLREATKNARLAANEFAENAGVNVGGIRDARQGSFYVRDAGSEYGDTAKIEKDVRVVTTITFYLTE
ncbi:MAG: SIMPL domain-containing protein [Gammaproteobacteria bacterium]|nr:SIMPL domain-containing protein [Gammaproteobacteria bacterium]MDH5800486.1 SIMPL domain-containing protein [Gammaproteobacteria bacterium]